MDKGLPALHTVDEHIGRKLRGLRETSGHSMEVFAHRIDLSLNQYRRYERGQSAMKCSLLVGIAEKLSVRLEYFFGDYPLAVKVKPEIKARGRSKAEWRRRIEELAQDKPIGTVIRLKHGTLPSIPAAKRIISLAGRNGWAEIHYTPTGMNIKKVDHP